MRGLSNPCVKEAKTPKQMTFSFFIASVKFVEKTQEFYWLRKATVTKDTPVTPWHVTGSEKFLF